MHELSMWNSFPTCDPIPWRSGEQQRCHARGSLGDPLMPSAKQRFVVFGVTLLGLNPRYLSLRADHLPLGPLPPCRKCLCKCELVHRRTDGATATEGKNIWGCMNFKSASYDQRRPVKKKAWPYRLGAPAVFHRGSFLISLLVLGYYDRSCLNDWLFVLLWGRLSFLSTNW